MITFNIKDVQIIWLELILSQYFKKEESVKSQRLYRIPADPSLFLGFFSTDHILGLVTSQFHTFISLPVEWTRDIPALWGVSRKFQEKDAIYEQTATNQ